MTSPRKKRIELGALVGILLLAAFLRLWALGDVPPGLEHDEVANWLIARDILSGRHAVYFSAAYGHEPLWQYAQAATVALLGDNWLGVRVVSVAFGLLSIVTAFLLARRLFGTAVALTAAAWLSVSFWHLFYSRVALRAISLPALSALAMSFLWRGVGLPVRSPSATAQPESQESSYRQAALGGFFLGLSAYTYMAARALPFVLGGLVLYLALLQRTRLCRGWRSLVLALLVAAAVAAPLAAWLLTHPGTEYRISEVSQPLDRLLAGDPGPVLDNVAALLKMWSVEGDPWDRQNIPGRPVFVEPVGALLFYVGLLVALWRLRRPEYGFILIWLGGSLIPSLVTSVAPSSIRTINALAVVYIFPGIALRGMIELGQRFKRQPWVPGAAYVAGGALALALALNLYLTTRDYFVRWPDDEGVQFVFQTGLTSVARDLDADPDDSLVAVAGLSVDTMDPPTFAVLLRRRDLALRWFDAREALVVPGGALSDLQSPVRIYVARIVPIAEALQAPLTDWGATASGSEQYRRYDIADRKGILSYLSRLTTAATLPGGETLPPSASFNGQVELLGYEWVGPATTRGQTAELLTYWRVIATPSPPLRIFVHLISQGSDRPIVQDDGLGSPPDTWQPGDLIVRRHRLALPADLPPGLYRPQIGWYNPETDERLFLESNGAPVADRLLLGQVDVFP